MCGDCGGGNGGRGHGDFDGEEGGGCRGQAEGLERVGYLLMSPCMDQLNEGLAWRVWGVGGGVGRREDGNPGGMKCSVRCYSLRG